MVIKLKIERHVERPKMEPIRLKIERVLDTPKKVKRTYKKRIVKIEGGATLKKPSKKKSQVEGVKEEIPIISEDIKETKIIVEPEIILMLESGTGVTFESNPISTDDLSELPKEAFLINVSPIIEDEITSPENMIEEKMESVIFKEEKQSE